MYTGPQIITDGLVLYLDAANPKSYPGSGTTWFDLSGKGNNSTLTNSPSYSSTNGGSFLFDGVDDYSTLPYNSSMDNNYTTLSTWVKSTFVTGPNNRHYIFDSIGHKVLCYADEPNTLNFHVITTTGGTAISYINSLVSEDSWLNIVGTFNGSTIALYVNGTLVSSNSLSGTVAASGGLTGRLMDYRLDGFETQGSAASFMLYDKALTADEVLQNYNATKQRFK
jgi:hypothetical protein